MSVAFTHVQVPPKSGYSNVPLSELSQAPAKHIRMGRGVVAITRYEKGQLKKQRPSTTSLLVSSSTNLTEAPSPVETSPGGTTKRKWFQTPLLRRRNHSMQDIGSSAHMIANSPALGAQKQGTLSVAAAPVVTMGCEQIDQTEVHSGTSTRASRRYGVIMEGHTPLFSRSSPYINEDFHDIQPPSSTISNLLRVPNIGSSMPQAPIYGKAEQKAEVDEEDQDESGRILLAALGLEDPAPSDHEARRLSVTDAHSAADFQSQNHDARIPELHVRPPTPTKPLTIRRLPSPPRTRDTRTPALGAIDVPPPLDSQDAFTYVFGPTLRSSMVAPGGAPPPYVPRQSMLYNPSAYGSQIMHEDVLSRERPTGTVEFAPVAPLSIQRRGEKQVIQRWWAVENQY